jgi:hypothetical protein
MKFISKSLAAALVAGALGAPGVASAFVSGSTGADGAFSPTVNVTIDVPSSGVFNYTSVNIPAGVTVKYRRNTINTPIVILSSSDVTIAGTLDISGDIGRPTGAAGDGVTGDDGTPGTGGPGGYDGGRGGLPGAVGSGAPTRGGDGLGAGAGGGALSTAIVGNGNQICGGGGGGFSTAGTNSSCRVVAGSGNDIGVGGASYGSSALLPLIGGSGGGGGSGGPSFIGSGGGGGGGAILIAASGTVSVTGTLRADGGTGGHAAGSGRGGGGGGGSGGAIRIIATTIAGNGTISAAGGGAGTADSSSFPYGGAGAAGRIRLESETYTRTAASNPVHSFGQPGQVFIAGLPTLRISSVAGVTAPENPTGSADITLPATTPNPVTVVFTTTGVPVGNTVLLKVTPAYGTPSSAVSPALEGSTASASASVSVNLPVGPSVLSAQTTYTVIAAVGDLLRNFAGNERVERVTLMATLGGPSKAKLITVSGKEYEVPAEVLRIAALGG